MKTLPELEAAGAAAPDDGAPKSEAVAAEVVEKRL